MKIQLTSRNLAPMVYHQENESHLFDLMVHGLIITNAEKTQTEITKITFSLMKGKQEIETRTVHDSQLKKEVKASYESLSNVTMPEVIGLKFSRKLPKNINLRSSLKINQGESVITTQQYFYLRNTVVPTKMEIKVDYLSGQETKQVKKAFQLKPAACKNRYIFPLKGKAICLSGPGGGGSGHRGYGSQEFAYDFISLNKECEMIKGDGKTNDKFHAFGDLVYAPA